MLTFAQFLILGPGKAMWHDIKLKFIALDPANLRDLTLDVIRELKKKRMMIE